jgi:hypothetical protein
MVCWSIRLSTLNHTQSDQSTQCVASNWRALWRRRQLNLNHMVASAFERYIDRKRNYIAVTIDLFLIPGTFFGLSDGFFKPLDFFPSRSDGREAKWGDGGGFTCDYLMLYTNGRSRATHCVALIVILCNYMWESGTDYTWDNIESSVYAMTMWVNNRYMCFFLFGVHYWLCILADLDRLYIEFSNRIQFDKLHDLSVLSKQFICEILLTRIFQLKSTRRPGTLTENDRAKRSRGRDRKLVSCRKEFAFAIVIIL